MRALRVRGVLVDLDNHDWIFKQNSKREAFLKHLRRERPAALRFPQALRWKQETDEVSVEAFQIQEDIKKLYVFKIPRGVDKE